MAWTASASRYHYDPAGRLVAVDRNGQPLATYTYDDPDTGLVRFGARDYHPYIGR